MSYSTFLNFLQYECRISFKMAPVPFLYPRALLRYRFFLGTSPIKQVTGLIEHPVEVARDSSCATHLCRI
jgi:hypothetical protein